MKKITGALAVQAGGTHYKDMPIQPVQYIHANGLSFLEGNVVKYITRHKAKGGKADVEKALHYCQLLLQLEYGEEAGPTTGEIILNTARKHYGVKKSKARSKK